MQTKSQRPPRIDFEALKTRADWRAVLDGLGLRLIGSGEQARVHCPFHDDRHPSCSVNLVGAGMFNCKAGDCGVSGNLFDLVQRMEGLTVRQTAERVAALSGFGLDDVRKGAERPQEARGEAKRPRTRKTSSGPPRRPEAPPDASAAAKPNRPLGFTLTLDPDHPYALARLPDRATRELFGVGHCGKGVMAGRLCIPIHNGEGQLVAYAGRWAGETVPEDEGRYKLPQGFRKELELFNLHRVARDTRWLVLVEGYFGAIRLYRLGVAAVALMGGSIAEPQLALLRRHCPELRLVVVLMDGDEAGRGAADSIAPRLARRLATRIVDLDPGDKPDTVDADRLRALLAPREAPARRAE
jgi:DNA primase